MSDHSELKRLLDACRAENCNGSREFSKAVGELFDVCTVETIAGLVSENERLTGFVVHRRAQADQYDEALTKIADQRDRLKVENEAMVEALNQIVRVTKLGDEAFGIACLVIGELCADVAMSKGEQP